MLITDQVATAPVLTRSKCDFYYSSFVFVISESILLVTVGGGSGWLTTRPLVFGASPVARLLMGLWQKVPEIDSAPDAWRLEYADINGEAAAVLYHRAKLETVFVFSVDADRITTIRAVRNPDKLAWLAAHTGPQAES